MSINQINNRDSGFTVRGILNQVITNLNEVPTSGTSSYAISSSYASLAQDAISASYVPLIPGSGININGTQISSRLVTVNGIQPINGNAFISLAGIITGTSASLILSSSGNITSSITSNTLWVISNDPISANNGKTYIFNSSSPGQWYPIAPLDVASADARYLMLGPQSPLTNNLNLGNNNIINVTLMQGTASWAQTASNAINSQTASFLPIGTYNITASRAQTASLAITASYIDAGNITTGFISNLRLPSQINVTGMTASFTGSLTGALIGTSSWAQSSSQALTASFIPALDLKENLTNKSTTTILGTSNTLYPTQNAVKTYVDNAIASIPGGGVTPSALTKVDDTNVTLSLGGSPSTALLNTASITVGWTGTLADSRITSATTWNAKQAALVSGTNIKTINGSSLLGSGNLTVSGGGGSSNGELFISDLEDGVNISGIGVKQLLNTLTNPTTSATYTNASAATKFPYAAAVYGTINVATFTYDDVVVMEAFQKATLEDRWSMLKSTPNKTYYYTKGGFLIANEKETAVADVDSKIFIFDMQGARFFYDGDVNVAHTLFKKPVLLADLGRALDRRWEFKNVNIDAQTLKAGSKGFEFCGGRSCNFQNIEIKNFDIAFHGGSLLQTQFVELATSQCEVGLLADLTLVSGSTAAQAVWQPILYNCRFRGVTTTAIGCKFEGVEHPRLYDVGWEGSDMLHAVSYDNKGNSVGKKITIINPRCEINSQGAGTFTGAAFKFTGSDYHFIKFEGAEIQNSTANFTLLEVESKSGTVMVVMSNCFGNTGDNRWLLKSTDNGGFVAWDFDNVHLQGNPTTAANVVDTATYPNIWVGGVTPSRTVKISPRTL